MSEDEDQSAEVKAIDLVRDPSRDPELAAKLTSFFASEPDGNVNDGRQLEEAAQNPFEQRQAQIRTLLEAADSELIEQLYRARRIDRGLGSIRLHSERTIDRFEQTVKGKVRVPSISTSLQPADISSHLKEDNTPQALLRDLARIEWDFDAPRGVGFARVRVTWTRDEVDEIMAQSNRFRPIDTSLDEPYELIRRARSEVRVIAAHPDHEEEKSE